MAFSIEAIQSKSKLNTKYRQHSMMVWSEFKLKEEESAILLAITNVKNIAITVLSKMKEALRKNNDNGSLDKEDLESIIVSEETNSEGFIEVNFAKKTEAG